MKTEAKFTSCFLCDYLGSRICVDECSCGECFKKRNNMTVWEFLDRLDSLDRAELILRRVAAIENYYCTDEFTLTLEQIRERRSQMENAFAGWLLSPAEDDFFVKVLLRSANDNA